MASTISAQFTLRFDDDTSKVIVHPDDNDKFVMSASEAAKVLRVFDQLDVLKFQLQFRGLLDHLGAWLVDNRSSVSRGILTRRDANLLFLVCSATKSYDSVLEDNLTDLDIAVAENEDFSKISLSVLAIPSSDDEEIGAFADPSLFIEITDAEQGRPRGHGDTLSGDDEFSSDGPR